jgi:DNA mismatch endonuclease (patch repair protein)
LDTLSPSERSARMALVRGRDTKPELLVRSLLHRTGYRFRLETPRLPGKPDLIFASRRKVVFVHGCFWHRHSDPDCKFARLPKSRLDFWLPKLESNRQRDKRTRNDLRRAGWNVEIVWECQLANPRAVQKKLRRFLGPPGVRKR